MGNSKPYMVDKDVVLAQVTMDEPTLLVQLADEDDHFGVHTLQPCCWHVCILHKAQR